MIFDGLNVAAFKIPYPNMTDICSDMLGECKLLDSAGCFIPHNMQTGRTNWRTASIKGALGNWRLSDPAFYRHLPEMICGKEQTREARQQYMKQWAYTELAAHCPKTTEFCQSIEGVGSFLSGARFLKLQSASTIKYHHDNNPHKEFRVTIGLSGIESENFVIHTGTNHWVSIPMKEGEAWFVDISLGHAVTNTTVGDRFRLGLQFYGPSSDWMLELFNKSENIIYADQLHIDAPFERN